MKKILLGIFLSITLFAFSQEPFKYDTIRVTKEDARNIHRYENKQSPSVQNQQRAQRPQIKPLSSSGFDARNLRYGINFGLNFSSNYSMFRLAPQVGYQLNKYVMTGVGVSYYYAKNRLYNQQERVYHYTNSLGANAFAYLYPMRFIAISAQPEVNYIWTKVKGKDIAEYDNRNSLVPSFVIGAGLRFGRAHAMIYYDMVQDVNSQYSSGVFYGVSVYF